MPVFNGISKYQDGVVTYIFDDNDKQLKIKKVVNGQSLDVSKSFRDFSDTVYRIGLLPNVIELYKKYRAVGLPENLAGVNSKLSIEELKDFMKLLNSPERSNVFYYLPKEKVLEAISRNQNAQLAVGKIRKIDARTADKIRQHSISFNISHVNGCISGFHNIECLNNIYNAAEQKNGEEVDVSSFIFQSPKDMRVVAKMQSNNPDKVLLYVCKNDELYGYKIKISENCAANSMLIRREKDKDGSYKYHTSIPFVVDGKNKDAIEQGCEDMFKLKDENGFFRYGVYNSRTVKVGAKKMKLSSDISYSGNPDVISITIETDGGFFGRGILRREHTPQGTKYAMFFDVDKPFENAAKLQKLSLDEFLRENVSPQLGSASENFIFEMMFHTFTDALDDDIQRVDADTIKVRNLEGIKSNEKVKLSLDKEAYLLERENHPDGISVYKYSYGYGAGTKIINGTKTVVSSEIMKNVLKKISKNNFNAAYKIDVGGKIHAYFKYKGVYFKLILTNSTPTCFPIMEKDCIAEIGNQIENIPSLE